MLWRLWSRTPLGFKIFGGVVFAILLYGRLIIPIVSGAAQSFYTTYLTYDVPFDYLIAVAFFISLAVWSFFEARNRDHVGKIGSLEQRISTLELDRDNLLNLVKSLELDMEFDDITGIPNENRFRSDIESELNSKNDFEICIVYIDLDHFGEINKEFLWTGANLVIRVLSENIRSEMRRNEHVFKRDKSLRFSQYESSVEIYRRFRGGDEFIILLRGSELDALKFVWYRLVKIFLDTSNAVSDKIDGRRLSFSGAVRQISNSEISFLSSQDKATRMQHIDGIISNLQADTEESKDYIYGFWFMWHSLPKKSLEDGSQEIDLEALYGKKHEEYSKFFEYFSRKKENVFSIKEK